VAPDKASVAIAPAFSAEHIQCLAGSLDYGVISIGADLRVNFLNNWLAEKTGILPAVARGKSLFELFPSIK